MNHAQHVIQQLVAACCFRAAAIMRDQTVFSAFDRMVLEQGALCVVLAKSAITAGEANPDLKAGIDAFCVAHQQLTGESTLVDIPWLTDQQRDEESANLA